MGSWGYRAGGVLYLGGDAEEGDQRALQLDGGEQGGGSEEGEGGGGGAKARAQRTGRETAFDGCRRAAVGTASAARAIKIAPRSGHLLIGGHGRDGPLMSAREMASMFFWAAPASLCPARWSSL